MSVRVAVLTFVLATSTARVAGAHPCPGTTAPKVTKKAAVRATSTHTAVPTARQVVALYARTGHVLHAANKADATAAAPLLLQYRLIHITRAIATSDTRAATVATLERIQAEAKKIAPGD